MSGPRDPYDDRNRGDWDPHGNLPPNLNPRRRADDDRRRQRPTEPLPGGRRRRPLATTGKILATTLSVLVLVISGFLWAGYHKYEGQIDRIDALPSPNSGRVPTKDIDGEDMNLLLVGNDSRDSATDQELSELGTERDGGSTNTDTMILVHIPADGRRATVVSFPRDLWVDIPGIGQHKLNSAYPNGSKGGTSKEARTAGARLLTETISNFSGLRIDHYVEVDLLGFYNITKAIGGVEVNLCKPAKDHFSGIDLPAGQQKIQGTQALAFVRQRHGLPGGDLDRIHRQQYFIGAVVQQMTSAGVLLNPVKLNRVLNAVTKSLHADPDFDPLSLAKQMRELAAGNVTFLTVPNLGSADRDGASVVLPDDDKIGAFFSSLGDSGSGANPKKTPAKPQAVPRDQVHVKVLNGSGQGGLAGQTSTELADAGFSTDGTGNADQTDSTTISYSSGQEAAARTLAAVVPGATLHKDDSLGDTVNLTLGTDFNGLNAGGGSSGSGGSGGSGSGGGGTGSGGAKAPSGAGQSTQQPDRTAADTSCIN